MHEKKGANMCTYFKVSADGLGFECRINGNVVASGKPEGLDCDPKRINECAREYSRGLNMATGSPPRRTYI